MDVCFFIANSIKGQFDFSLGKDKRGSLVMRNSKTAIVGCISINFDQITLTFLVKTNLIGKGKKIYSNCSVGGPEDGSKKLQWSHKNNVNK